MRTVTTDVLVVGAGPTGLTAAGFLGKLGVDALTLSRHAGPANQPRGSFTNQRTIEVLRDLGIEDEIAAVGTPLRSIPHNVMATSFTGPEILRYQSYGVGKRLSDYMEASPCANYNLPQHIIEPVLLRGAVQRGANVQFHQELQTIEQSDDAVLAQVTDRVTGERYQIRAKYAIAADGGRSSVAEQVGIPFTGESALNHMVNAWVEVDLTDYVSYRPAGIYIILQPGGDSWVGSGSFVTVAPWKEWLMSREYDPANGEPDLSDEAVIEATRSLIGDKTIPVRVKGTSKWQVNNLVATQYRAGRVFVAGDAAHRHSPSGGLGTNTSIQDAYNLAWKLAFVLRGHADDALLDSYDEERQPVGQGVIERTMINLKNKSKVGEAVGLRRGQSNEEGWAALNSLFADLPDSEERRRSLTEAVELQNYRSNAHGMDLGQRYTSRAVVGDGTPFPEPTRDPILYYHPTTHPGAYLPHVWLERDHERVSTLDLAGHGQFTLIVGIGGEPWTIAAAKVSAELGIELPVFAVGYRCDYDDVLGDWGRVREIGDGGALLVRPDRHIAWRSHAVTDDPHDDLANALRTVLSLDPATRHLTTVNAGSNVN
ncbi:2,4-dichlorophenol 6-monooxygenase (plasmid) [Rhodococcus erythropolis]|uniref:FAD-dependent monooxygenase n=1 Tax=Rhodococcus erythropolis TaxID=1833 RepID=UPI00061B88E9|nr:FAD-dependent monooxygenase [Rhodococcus erythropolis]AKE01087.1 2,4-dichlorophenol 6-monooxygenase [Rhodococcus erythropolis]